MKNLIKSFAIGFFAFLTATGCLEADKKEQIKYDANADSFTVLSIFKNIAGKEEGDLNNLEKLWRLREKIIISPHATIIKDDSGKMFQHLDLSVAKTGDPIEAPFSLNGITVKAGVFFLSAEKTLCYYHYTTLPGKAVDGWLSHYVTAAARENVVEEAEDELERRAGGGKRITSAEYCATLEKKLQKNIKDEEAEEKENGENEVDILHPFVVLDDASLKKLADDKGAAVKDISREKDVFKIKMELTKDGAKAFKSLHEELQLALKKYAGSKDEEARIFFLAVSNLQVTVDGGEALISLQYVNFMNDLNTRDEAGPDADGREKYEQAVNEMKSRGIPVKDDIDIRKVEKDFLN